ncbi:hypothetical protein SteCoe_27935 [Stentor coeruleus]|uniref:Uncharacterized protein n=1 Tax=Stentor coeruleus TaxID=5963 RepID=A0A1R2B9B9_9CILI|nr:hypothetical protein SteCoe_27935 [Stentor coeruleus]
MEAIFCFSSSACKKNVCYKHLLNDIYIYSCKSHLKEFRQSISEKPEKFRKLLNTDTKLEWIELINKKISEIESQAKEASVKFSKLLKNIEMIYCEHIMRPLIKTKGILKAGQANIRESMIVDEGAYCIIKNKIYENQEYVNSAIISDLINNLKALIPQLKDDFSFDSKLIISDIENQKKIFIEEIKQLKQSKSILDLTLKNADQFKKAYANKNKELLIENNKLKRENENLKNDFTALEYINQHKDEIIKILKDNQRSKMKILDERHAKGSVQYVKEIPNNIKLDKSFINNQTFNSKKDFDLKYLEENKKANPENYVHEQNNIEGKYDKYAIHNKEHNDRILPSIDTNKHFLNESRLLFNVTPKIPESKLSNKVIFKKINKVNESPLGYKNKITESRPRYAKKYSISPSKQFLREDLIKLTIQKNENPRNTKRYFESFDITSHKQ